MAWPKTKTNKKTQNLKTQKRDPMELQHRSLSRGCQPAGADMSEVDTTKLDLQALENCRRDSGAATGGTATVRVQVGVGCRSKAG